MSRDVRYLTEIQTEVFLWQRHNFPEATPTQQFLGVVEEVGEISHAILKAEQGIRGYSLEDESEVKDGIGDLMIFLMNFCSLNGWDLQMVLEEVWGEVSQRDWQENPETGKRVVTYVTEE